MAANLTLTERAEPPASETARELLLFALAGLIYVSVAFALLHDTLVGDQVLSASQTVVELGPFTDAQREGLTADDIRFSDSFRQFEPWTRLAAANWAASGSLPLWKDDSLLGAPLLGNGQSAMLYPPHWLAIALGAPPSSYGWRGLTTLVIGALATWLLARHLRCGFMASVIAGVCFGFYGFNIAYLKWPHSNVSCLFPLVLLTTLRVVQSPSRARLVALAAACALQHLGGHPETALLSQLTAFALGFFRARQLLSGWTAPLRRVGHVAAGFVLGALFGGPQLVPLLEYLQLSEAFHERSVQITQRFMPSVSVTLGVLICLCLAGLAGRKLLGRPRAVLRWSALLFVSLVVGTRLLLEGGGSLDHLVGLLSADWLGGPERLRLPLGHNQASSLYPGPALALSLAGLVLSASLGWTRLWTGTLLVGFVLQSRTPGLQQLLESVPVLGLMPSSRVAMVTQLALALLAALGFDALRRPAVARARRTVLALFMVLLLAGVTSLAWASLDGELGTGSVTGAYPAGYRPLGVTLAPPEPMLAEPFPCRGTFHAPGDVERVEVQWSQSQPLVEASFHRQHAANRVGGGRYVFEAELPGHQLAAVTTMLRVRVTLADGEGFMSPAIGHEASLSTVLSSAPVMPAEDTAQAQLLTLLAVAAVTLLLLGRARAPHVLLLPMVLACLPYFAPAQLPRTPINSWWPDSPALQRMRQVMPQGRVITAGQSWLAETLAGYGIPQVLGDDALVPRHTAQLLRAAVAPDSAGVRFKNLPGGRKPDDRLVDLLAAQVSFAPASDFQFTKYEGFRAHERLDLFVNASALPRARLVPRARVEPDNEAALKLLADPTFDIEAELVLADGQELNGTLAPDAIGSAAVVLTDPGRVVVDINPADQAYLLLADSHYPGWVALVDGEPREIHRADVALRAVLVGPGDRRVEFRYQPGSWRLGCALAGLGLAFSLAMLWLRPRGD